VPDNDPIPGAVIAIQSFGDVLVFTPHCHILVTDGCVYGDTGMFLIAPPLELKKLEAIFRHTVVRRLLNTGQMTKELIAMLSPGRQCRRALSSAALASLPLRRRRGRIWRVTSSGRQCPTKEGRTWIRRGQSWRDPKDGATPKNVPALSMAGGDVVASPEPRRAEGA
jgi:hypothetical protein